MRMTRNRASTHMIEHLVDGLADHMRFAAARVPAARSAQRSRKSYD